MMATRTTTMRILMSMVGLRGVKTAGAQYK
jgi:hypothetical protein